MLKTLSYVSKINKTEKEMKSLFQKLMRSLKITFNEKENNIKYDEFYFNGIQTPKDIEFREIGINSFKILWKIDNLNLINIDKNKIKYKIELRKEKNNEKFTQIYEGNNTNFSVSNVITNTNYEIRICSFYNDFEGPWSLIQKVKTLNSDPICDSIILEESQRKNEFLKIISEWCQFKKLVLLYRGTRDGTKSNIFHDKCDNQGPTICLYKNDKGYIFGGFASISWTNKDDRHFAQESFIFTLTNIHNIKPTKFPNLGKDMVYHNQSYGPTFNEDICIYSDFRNQTSYSNFPKVYQDILGKGKSIFTNNNSTDLKVKEIEIFKLLK